MKRRDFLKLIGLAPIAPSVLAAKPKSNLTRAVEELIESPEAKKSIQELCGGRVIERPIGFAETYIPKGEFGWVKRCCNIYVTENA